MKTINWKYTMVRKSIASISAACVLLFAMSADATLLTFDTLGDGSSIPAGYGKLQWDNFYSLNAVTYGTSGYRAGLVSKPNVAYNGYGDPASIYVNSGSFTPIFAYLTAAWNDKLQVEIQGYLGNKLVFDHTYVLSATKPTLIVIGVKVTELDFISFGGTPHPGYDGGGEHFAMDNLFVVP